MLELLRGSISGWVAKIFIGLLVISFGVWGIADVFRTNSAGAVVTVGETEVNATDYALIYQRNINNMSRQFGTQLTREQARAIGVDSQVMAEVVAGAVLDENARQLNLGLSKNTLARLIGEDEAFKGADGNFDRNRFQQAIRNAQMREDDYLNNRNKVAVRNQIFEATGRGDVLPKLFYKAAAQYNSEERKFDFIVLSAKNLGIDPKPEVDDVETYFKNNVKRYAAPEFRKIAILKVEPEDIVDTIQIDADTIKNDYETRKDKYGKPERRRIQQIIFRDQEEAEAAAKSLAEGTLFETLASEMDLEVADLDLGLMAKSELPDAKLGDAAFSLELNAVSGVIEGSFGPVIIRAIEIEPAVITPFEEVKDQIKKELALRQAADEVIALQDSIEDLRAGGSTLEEIAKSNGLKLRVIDAVSAEGKSPDDKTIENLPDSANLLRKAFEADIGEETDYLNVGSAGYAWYEVKEIIKARDRTFDEVKDKAAADWRKAEIALRIGKRASELKGSAESGIAMIDIASAIGTSVQSTGFIARSGTTESLNANAIRAGFSGPDGHVALAKGIEENTQILLKVTGIKVPDSTELPRMEKDRIEVSAGNDVLEQLVDELRNRYGVEVDQNLITLVQGGQTVGGRGHPENGDGH